jgi:hypothetical protein
MKSGLNPVSAKNPQGGPLTSSSRLHVWWLRVARGYRIMSIRKEPKSGVFGAIHYHRTWILMRKKPTSDSRD